MKHITILLIIFSITSYFLSAQNEVELRTDGIVVPRTTTGAVASPVEGMLIYDTSIDGYQYYNGANWSVVGSGAFERSGTLVRQKTGYDTDDFIFGRDSLPILPTTIDPIFYFNKTKGAFRGGFAYGNVWIEDSLGYFSFGYGQNVKASGQYSIAMGSRSVASGSISTALGQETLASGSRATAMGSESIASGSFATSIGASTIASGFVSTAIGHTTEASGDYGATALGISTVASGEYGATALGYVTEASGDRGATALGFNTIATGDNCTVVGRYNDTIVAAGFAVGDTSPLFIVGNGEAWNKSNAMVVRKNGQVSLQNYTFPILDGSANQVMTTDGLGQLSWSDDDWSNNSDDINFSTTASTGRVGIGIDSPLAFLHLKKNSTGALPQLLLEETDANDFVRMRFQNTSQTGFWTIATKKSSTDSLSVMYFNMDGSTSNNFLELRGNGSHKMDGTLSQTSDIRLKSNIVKIENRSSDLMYLSGYNYNWKNPERSQKTQIGLIAQEVQQYFPELVREDEYGILSVNYNGLIPVLLEGHKEQEAQIKELKSQIKNQSDQLKKEINDLRKLIIENGQE